LYEECGRSARRDPASRSQAVAQTLLSVPPTCSTDKSVCATCPHSYRALAKTSMRTGMGSAVLTRNVSGTWTS